MSAAVVTAPADARRRWRGGPLRLWSPIRKGGRWIPLADGGFGGPYVCDGCQKPVVGVYRVRETWLCAACKVRSEAGDVT